MNNNEQSPERKNRVVAALDLAAKSLASALGWLAILIGALWVLAVSLAFLISFISAIAAGVGIGPDGTMKQVSKSSGIFVGVSLSGMMAIALVALCFENMGSKNLNRIVALFFGLAVAAIVSVFFFGVEPRAVGAWLFELLSSYPLILIVGFCISGLLAFADGDAGIIARAFLALIIIITATVEIYAALLFIGVILAMKYKGLGNKVMDEGGENASNFVIASYFIVGILLLFILIDKGYM